MIILLYISPHKFFTYFLLATLISSLGVHLGVHLGVL